MTTPEESKQIYKQAIEKWGVDSQVDMLQEECIELALAIRKFRREPSAERFKDVCEELADVTIMTEQMKEIPNIFNSSMVFKEQKLKRLQKRITNNIKVIYKEVKADGNDS